MRGSSDGLLGSCVVGPRKNVGFHQAGSINQKNISRRVLREFEKYIVQPAKVAVWMRTVFSPCNVDFALVA